MNNTEISKILSNNIVVDAHLDLLYDLVYQRSLGRKNVLRDDYLESFKAGGVNVVVSSIFIDGEYLPELALRKALNQISTLYAELEEASGDHFCLCTSYDDILKAVKNEKIAILLSFEGVEPLYNDLSLLPIFYKLGVRLIGLTWSRRNFAADGCFYKAAKEGKKGGLTDFGVNLIETAEKLGMIIDVSHLNDEGFDDVIHFSNHPVIASHSNSRTLANTMRNLTDDQIKAIAKTGGVIGINAASLLVSDETGRTNPDISGLVDHIEYMLNLVGPRHIGLGFDLCDRIMSIPTHRSVSGINTKIFDTLKSHAEIPKLIEEMLKRGINQEQVSDIIGNNFMRIYKDILKQ